MDERSSVAFEEEFWSFFREDHCTWGPHLDNGSTGTLKRVHYEPEAALFELTVKFRIVVLIIIHQISYWEATHTVAYLDSICMSGYCYQANG